MTLGCQVIWVLGSAKADPILLELHQWPSFSLAVFEYSAASPRHPSFPPHLPSLVLEKERIEIVDLKMENPWPGGCFARRKHSKT